MEQIKIVEVPMDVIDGENQGPNVLQSLHSLTDLIFLAQARTAGIRNIKRLSLFMPRKLSINLFNDCYQSIILNYFKLSLML